MNLLLEKCIVLHYPTAASDDDPFAKMLDDGFVTSTAPITRWDSSGVAVSDFQFQLQTVLLIEKASRLINKFGMDLTDIDYLWNKSVIPGVPSLKHMPIRSDNIDTLPDPTGGYRTLINFIRWIQVKLFADRNTCFTI